MIITGILKIINKNNLLGILKILTSNNASITNPVKIANVFNNYYILIAAETKANIKHYQKHFSDDLRKKSSWFLSSKYNEKSVALH